MNVQDTHGCVTSPFFDKKVLGIGSVTKLFNIQSAIDLSSKLCLCHSMTNWGRIKECNKCPQHTFLILSGHHEVITFLP